jgi:hypothetical protein
MGIGNHLTNDAVTHPKNRNSRLQGSDMSLKLTHVWIMSDIGDVHVQMSTELGYNSCGFVQIKIVQHMD